MMRRSIILCAVFVLFFATSAWAEDYKIGIIDLQQVLEESDPGKEAMGKLEQDMQGMKKELETKKKELNQLQEEMQKQGMVLSQEAQVDKETEYQQKARELQGLYNSYKKKLQIKERKLREPVIRIILKVSREYGEKNGYTLLMDKKNSGVIYNDDAVEITQKIITEVNEAWKEEKAKKSSGEESN